MFGLILKKVQKFRTKKVSCVMLMTQKGGTFRYATKSNDLLSAYLIFQASFAHPGWEADSCVNVR